MDNNLNNTELLEKIKELESKLQECKKNLNLSLAKEKKWEEFFDNVEDGYFEADTNGNFIFFNNSAYKLLDFSKEDFDRDKAYNNEGIKKLCEVANEAYQKKETIKVFGIEIKRKDSESNFVDIFAFLNDKNSDILRIKGIIRNITRRKQIERELIKTKNFLENILKSSIDGVITTDLHGTIIYTTPQILNFSGYTPEEIIGQKIADSYEKGKDEAKKIMKILTEKGELSNYELKFLKKDGNKVDINLSASLVKNEKGDVIGTLGIFRDVTARKILESQLRHAQKMQAISTLTGGIAHNFNNLLMAIQGYTSLLLLKIEEDTPLHKIPEQIEFQIKKGAKLISRLMEYAKEGRHELNLINLNSLATKVSDEFSITYRNKINIKLDIDENIPMVLADDAQIEHALTNIYTNAIESMPYGGNVYIKTYKINSKKITSKRFTLEPIDYVVLSIKDTGIGIDKENIDRIFEPFFSTKDVSKGAGLGLTSAYGIISSHNGYIDIESEKNNGTVCSIYLPAC
ncbi:MAG: PAS domain S-box protein [Desulfobacterales bacterium]|nr:PAS domain S-box protein [Desulfobacterales bacterium]